MTELNEIRDYLVKIANAAGLADTGEWAGAAGLPLETVAGFLDGGDVSLREYLQLCKAARAVALPVPASKADEVVMLIEEEGIYAEGTTPSPFDKYRNL